MQVANVCMCVMCVHVCVMCLVCVQEYCARVCTNASVSTSLCKNLWYLAPPPSSSHLHVSDHIDVK